MRFLDRCYKKESDVVAREIAKEYILVPIGKGIGDFNSIYTLNEVGNFIWELIDGKRKVREIRDIILKEYRVRSEEAEKDLKSILSQLEKLGLIGRF